MAARDPGGRAPAAPKGPRSGGALLPIRRVQRQIPGDLRLPAVAVRQQLVFVVHQLFARLGRKLEIRPLDDRIDRTGFLTEPAIDALDRKSTRLNSSH